MSGQEWTAYVVIFAVAALVMWRLDRLGKQVEAVRDHLLLELGNEETKSETSRAREWEKNERTKERRQFWIFWCIVALAALVWYAISQR